MAGMIFRKAGAALLAILKWTVQAALVALKLALGMAKLLLLSLLLLALAIRGISGIAGVPAGRR